MITGMIPSIMIVVIIMVMPIVAIEILIGNNIHVNSNNIRTN